MHHNIKAPQNPTTAAAHGFESHQGTVRAGIARDAEQKENTAHDEKTISFLISFEYENFTFTIQNSWPKINAQCRCTASQLRLLLGRAARNNASSNASPLRSAHLAVGLWCSGPRPLSSDPTQPTTKKTGTQTSTEPSPPDPLLQLTRCILGNAKPQQQHNNAEDVRHVAAQAEYVHRHGFYWPVQQNEEANFALLLS